MSSGHNPKHTQFQTGQGSSSLSQDESKPKCICARRNSDSHSREPQFHSRIPQLQSRAPQHQNKSQQPIEQEKIRSEPSTLQTSKHGGIESMDIIVHSSKNSSHTQSSKINDVTDKNQTKSACGCSKSNSNINDSFKTTTHFRVASDISSQQDSKNIQRIKLDDNLTIQKTKSGCGSSKSRSEISTPTSKPVIQFCASPGLNSGQNLKDTESAKLNTNLGKNDSKFGCGCSKSKPDISTLTNKYTRDMCADSNLTPSRNFKHTEPIKLNVNKETKSGCYCSKSKSDVATTSPKPVPHVCADSSSNPSQNPNYPQPIKVNQLSVMNKTKNGSGCSKSQPDIRTTTSKTVSHVDVDLKRSKQKYKINVTQTVNQYNDADIIKIPIQLMVSIKESNDIIAPKSVKPITSETFMHESVGQPKTPTYPVKLLMNTHCNNDYAEPYMNELLDDEDIRIAIPTKTSCFDMYAEGYIKEGYSASHEDVEIQTDLALGPKLLSPSLNSMADEEYFTGDEDPDSLEESASRIQWEDVILPPKGTIEIGLMETEESEVEISKKVSTEIIAVSAEDNSPAQKKKKKKGISSCCSSGEEEEPYVPSVEPKVKLSFVYGKHCGENEQYTQTWLLGNIYNDKSDSPCSSKPEIPWPKLTLEKHATIRAMSKEKLPEKQSKTTVADSTPCNCRPREAKLHSGPSFTAVKSSVTFSGDKLVTLYPAPIQSTKPIVVSDKLLKPCALPAQKASSAIIITKLSGRSVSDHGKMKTKISLSAKDLQRLLDSKGNIKSMDIKQDSMHRKILSTKICSSNEIKAKSSYSSPTLGQAAQQPSCVEPQCTDLIRKPCKYSSSTSLDYKQDPVVTALLACEAELKPVKQALNKVQQKLRNMNMPELDSLFNKGTNDFLSNGNMNSYKNNIGTGFRSGVVNPVSTMKDRSENRYTPSRVYHVTQFTRFSPRENRDNIQNSNLSKQYQNLDNSSGQYQNMGMSHTARPNQNMGRSHSGKPYQNIERSYLDRYPCHNIQRPEYGSPYHDTDSPNSGSPYHNMETPYQNRDNSQYDQFPGQSYSQTTSCCPSMQNFTYPYDMDFQQAVDHFPSKSNLRKPGKMQPKKVSYKNYPYSIPDSQEYYCDQSPSEYSCCCFASQYNDNRKIKQERSEAEISYPSTNSCSEESIPKQKSLKKKKKSGKTKITKEESEVNLCPFLEAIKTIMTIDNKNVTKKGSKGLCYHTEMSTRNIKNMRMHMRVRSSKKKSTHK